MNIQELNKQLKEKHGLELYDFGDFTTVMPMTDLSGSYLTKSIMFVMKPSENRSSMIMGVELPHRVMRKGGMFELREDIVDRIAAWFKVKAQLIDEPEALPNEKRLTLDEIEASLPDEKVRIPTEREITVRKAIANLARFGLRITGFKCHPMTFCQIVNEEISVRDEITVNSNVVLPLNPKHTYGGIPLEQDSNEPTPLS